MGSPRVEAHDAPKSGSVHRRITLRKDDVVDLLAEDTRALDQGAHELSCEFMRRNRPKLTSKASDRSSIGSQITGLRHYHFPFTQ